MRCKKSDFSFSQINEGGGSLNTVPLTYIIYEKPVGDLVKYGYLAYVDEVTRKLITQSGYGELTAHIDRIKKRVGEIRKIKEKRKGIQFEFDL